MGESPWTIHEAAEKGSSKKLKYSRSSGSDVKNEMRRYKKGTAKADGAVRAAR